MVVVKGEEEIVVVVVAVIGWRSGVGMHGYDNALSFDLHYKKKKKTLNPNINIISLLTFKITKRYTSPSSSKYLGMQTDNNTLLF